MTPMPEAHGAEVEGEPEAGCRAEAFGAEAAVLAGKLPWKRSRLPRR